MSSLRSSPVDQEKPPHHSDLIAGNPTCPADHHQNMPLLFCSLIASQSTWLHSQKPKDHFVMRFFFFFCFLSYFLAGNSPLSAHKALKWFGLFWVAPRWRWWVLIHSLTLTARFEYQVHSNALHNPVISGSGRGQDWGTWRSKADSDGHLSMSNYKWLKMKIEWEGDRWGKSVSSLQLFYIYSDV